MSETYLCIIAFFIMASLVFYVNLGGADFGAGILELLPNPRLQKEQRDLINRAMGPVWEANHIWLILLIVILFMAFPKVFTILMVSLHIPIVMLLIGIVIRGTTFVFRHYDPSHDERLQKKYSFAFGLSSLWSSFWIGVIASSLYYGQINPEAKDFYGAYVAPWFGAYPLAMGFFIVLIYAYLAAIFLIGETDNSELKKLNANRALALNFSIVFWGAGILFYGYRNNLPGLKDFFHNPISAVCLVLASLAIISLWSISKRRRPWLTRTVAAFQTVLIMVGWFANHMPHMIYTVNGDISLWEATAPEATLRQLVLALLVGSLFIFPSLYFLMRVFKLKVPRA